MSDTTDLVGIDVTVIDPGAIDPNEKPIPLEGASSDEQDEWDDDEGPKLSLEDRRLISQQRTFWIADCYFKYEDETTEKYTMMTGPVRVLFPSATSFDPIEVSAAYRGPKPAADVRDAFEAHFQKSILDDPSVWKFTWGADAVKAVKA